MHSSGPRRRRGARVLVVLVIASVLTMLGTSVGSAAVRAPQATVGTGKWQQAMEQLPLPGKGCFTGAYPKVQWQRTECKAAPHIPFEPAPPGANPPLQSVGGGGANDYSAVVTGLMSSATGSFDSESSGVTESGPIPLPTGGVGPVTANTYSLQLNTQTFRTTSCSSSSSCVGWEQFVYDSTDNEVYIQYWLEHYDATCPSGWTTFTFPQAPTDTYCYTSSLAGPLTVAAPTAADLSSVTLTGRDPAGGTDAVVMTDGGNAVGSATDPDSTLNLASSWNTAEFGVFGDGNGTEASFSAGTNLEVGVVTHSGTKAAPECVMESFTGETNSLNLAGTPALGTQASPTMVSDQTSSPGTPSCATASGIGDTHLTTFRDLLYDFQASGDFQLATTGPGFVVQTRQVSGAPTWPNADVNQDIATRVGTSDVAVCTTPTRLVVNNRITNLANGTQLNLPGGGHVSLSGGNTYLIRGVNGNSVRAQVNPGNPTWINVAVGLNRWPVTETGLLANAGTNVNAIESRGGTVLTAPFAFNEFYGLYGNSWRVPANQSLLSACGRQVVSGNPGTLFYTGNLPPALAKQAGVVCLDAGVRVTPLLDACTVDVAVLGRAAAKAYLSQPANVTLGQITLPPYGGPALRG